MMAPTVVLREGAPGAGARQRRLEPDPLGDPADDRARDRRRPRGRRGGARAARSLRGRRRLRRAGDRHSRSSSAPARAIARVPRAQPVLRRRAGGRARRATAASRVAAIRGAAGPRSSSPADEAACRGGRARPRLRSSPGCGFDVEEPDLFLVTRTGAGVRSLIAAGQRRGTIPCNGGKAEEAARSRCCSQARDLADSLNNDVSAKLRFRARARAACTAYTVKVPNGTMSLPRHSRIRAQGTGATRVVCSTGRAPIPCGLSS